MNDMSSVIVPKSDQINAEDFISGPATYRIEGVAISPGTEQPVSIKLVGEQRVWRPCKSMSRVLVAAWGADASAYTGRSVTLYRDPNVKWGGLAVGGIRVSHMSHIDHDLTLALTATKGKRAPHVVRQLAAEVVQHPAQASFGIEDARALITGAADMDTLKKAWQRRDMAPFRGELQGALDDRKAALTFEPEGRADADMGEPDDAAYALATADRLKSAANADEIGAIMAETRDRVNDLDNALRDTVWDAQREALARVKKS